MHNIITNSHLLLGVMGAGRLRGPAQQCSDPRMRILKNKLAFFSSGQGIWLAHYWRHTQNAPMVLQFSVFHSFSFCTHHIVISNTGQRV